MRNRLKPIDTSDPRSIHGGFRETLERAYRLITDAALKTDPPKTLRREARQVEKDADVLLRRAMHDIGTGRVTFYT